MLTALDTTGLLALLQAGETVLFPSTRAAQTCRSRFDCEQRTRGLRAWDPPRALAWTAWTASLWSQLTLEGVDDRMLLNQLQEESVWLEIIAAFPGLGGSNRGSLQQLAALSRSALQLAAAHLPGTSLDRLQRTADTHDSRAFGGWQRLFVQRCADEQFLSLSLLESALAAHLESGNFAPPPSFHLVGFEELTPAQTRLLEQCRAAGTRIETYRLLHPQPPAALKSLVTAPDLHGEVRDALGWIHQRLGVASATPPSIALIFPDPGAERVELEPQLRAILAPELEPVGTDLSSTPWHFSDGLNLASMSLIQHALTLLRWLLGDLAMEQVGTLLLSPFLGHSEPFETRARFEMGTLRRERRLRPEFTLPELLRVARKGSRALETTLQFPELEAVHRLAGDPGVLTGNGSHADWAELVRKLLRSAGWPGPRQPTAEEFRATEAWDGVLDWLATLDFTPKRVSFSDFLSKLEQQAANVTLPSTLTGAPLQILSLAEAEGCSFDAALILRATDAHLPPRERLHPLLGAGLQRVLQMPGTDPALTHARTGNRLRALGERCGDLLLFAATSDGDGPLRPTPLAAELELSTREAFGLLADASADTPVAFAFVPERTARLPLPSFAVHGGARLLELQAACGFRAFATLRLQASAPETKSLGMDARERGNTLHSALEQFWTEIKSQMALKAMHPQERSSAVRRSVRRALEKDRLSAMSGDRWADAYLNLAEQRLCTLLERWLEFELERGDFTVLSPERKEVVHVGPFELEVRPDRIDRVDGGFVLVDYKTSADLSTEHWLGERPQAPQLPLYTLLGEPDEVRGLAFARIRPGKDMNWIGLQKEEGDLRNHRSARTHDLEYQVSAWRRELDRLANDFAEGAADIDPKSYPGTCKHCEQRLLCRLNAATLLESGEVESPDLVLEDFDG